MINKNETENIHLNSINKIFSIVLVAHLPVALLLGHSFNTGLIMGLLASLAICSMPIFLTYFTNNYKLAAISHGVALMFFSGLLIHLSKGMIETHFHIFVSLAILIVFANPLVVLGAAVTIALHHIGFFFLLPESVFNYQASYGILLVHAGFVIIQTGPCMWIAQKFRGYIIEQGIIISQIEEICKTMNLSIGQLTTSNDHLSSSSDLQISSVTETAQTIHEISAMATQTSENANDSKKLSELTKASANQGITIIGQVGEAIFKIKQSNTLVLEQIGENKNQLDDIIITIKQIEAKTKIINDIVFQTKLLSFNASVEAARAGENGKGFSVVAEEIGKLASTSGVASREINDLINTSVNKVQAIAAATETKVNELVIVSQNNIKVGEEKVQSCDQTFKELSNYIQDLNEKMSGISVASNEQSSGILEINKAIQLLENNNHKNHETLKASVDASNHLTGLAGDLDELVFKLSAKKSA